MSLQTDETLKGYFEIGSTPTESNFEDLIDSKVSTLNGLERDPSIGQRVEFLSCAIRNTNGVWAFINNASHIPNGFASVVTGSNGTITVNYKRNYTKVLHGICTTDDTYASVGLGVGASVGTSLLVITLAKLGTSFSVEWDGSAWNTIDDTLSFVNGSSFSGGIITLNHAAISRYASGVTATAYNGNYIAQINSTSASNTSIALKTFSGSLVTSPEIGTRVHINHGGSWLVPHANSEITGSNLWISASFLV